MVVFPMAPRLTWTGLPASVAVACLVHTLLVRPLVAWVRSSVQPAGVATVGALFTDAVSSNRSSAAACPGMAIVGLAVLALDTDLSTNEVFEAGGG